VLINGQHIRSYKDINFSPDNLLWSPVDNRLMMPHGGQNTLAIYNADTEEMMTLATTEAYSSVVTPVWSPTGKQIAFVSDDAKRLYIVNTSDTETEQLPLPTDTNEKADSLIRRIYWAP
jgi:Tol biopolymer transport system component